MAPLTLSDGTPIYVEPMAFARRNSADAILLGEPVYTSWSELARGTRPGTPPGAGVLLREGSRAALVGVPIALGVATDYRVAVVDSSYAVAFAVRAQAESRGREGRLIGYWFGRTDGSQWRDLAQLPLPEDELVTSGASSLAATGDSGFVIAIPVARGASQDIVVFTSKDGRRWNRQELGVRQAAYVALHPGPPALRLYVVHPDATALADANSLFLYEFDDARWVQRGLLKRGGTSPIHHPVIRDSRRPAIAWIEHNEQTGARTAFASEIAATGSLAAPAMLATGVEYVSPVFSGEEPARWLVSEVAADKRRLLLVESSSGTARTIDAVNDPFRGFAVAYGDSVRIRVLGPVLDTTSEAPLVTQVIHLTPRCASTTGRQQDRAGNTPEIH